MNSATSRRLAFEDSRPPRVFEETNFEQKLRRDRRRPLVPLERTRVPAELALSERLGIFRAASLTPMQWRVLMLHLHGHTFPEIGRALGHTKQNARSIYRLARRKLLHACEHYPYVGLGDVYLSEVSRGRVPSQKRAAR